MPKASPSRNGRNGHSASESPSTGLEELIEQAEALRTSLREAHSRLGLLIAGLRQHRKQSRLVRSTLASLKQLQGPEG